MNKIVSTVSPIINGKHQLSIRVYYEDTDSGGIIYYANYLKFAERARTEMFRETGYVQKDTIETYGASFVVRACSAEFHKPGLLDDVLEVETEVLKVQGASIKLRQIVSRGNELLVSMEIKLACIDSNGKAMPLPKNVRDQMLGLLKLKGHG